MTVSAETSALGEQSVSAFCSLPNRQRQVGCQGHSWYLMFVEEINDMNSQSHENHRNAPEREREVNPTARRWTPFIYFS